MTNEKQLFTRAGLTDLDLTLEAMEADPAALSEAVKRTQTICRDALELELARTRPA